MSSKSIKKENRVKWHKRNKFAGVKLLVDTSIIRCLGIYIKLFRNHPYSLIEKVIISSLLNNISLKTNRLLVKKVRSRLFADSPFLFPNNHLFTRKD